MKTGEAYNPWMRFYGAVVPNWLLERTEVTPGAKLCFARLMQYAGKDGECFPSIERLATELGVSRRQADRYLAELRRVRLIKAERQGQGKPNRYHFLWHSWAEAAKQRKQVEK